MRIALTFGLTVATLAASIGKSSFSDRSNVHLYFSSHPVSILTLQKSLENSESSSLHDSTSLDFDMSDHFLSFLSVNDSLIILH